VRRREFIQQGALILGSLPLFPPRLRAGLKAAAASSPVLVQVFLRGGADGLNIVVPYADPDYRNIRPALAIGPPGEEHGALDLDGFFGLHPRLTGLHSLFQQGNLAVISACGSHHPTRSHFDAMDVMETGGGLMKLDEGWLNRYLQASQSEGGVFRAVALNPTLPLTLSGEAEALALSGLEALQVSESPQMSTYLEAVEELYSSRSDHLGRVSRSALEAIRLGGSVLDPSSYTPDPAADYGDSEFGRSLRAVAQMIKADVGVEVAAVDLAGWDTHTNQGDGDTGELANALGTLDRGLQAITVDLGSLLDRVVIIVMTEFGRTAEQNGSGGTDHGHGASVFVLGGRVQGGRIYGDWPGLKSHQLYEARDLAVTTDYRRILGEALESHMECRALELVFPDYDFSAEKPLHLFG
jgi:uncharacterized protein (DUF1501 family)